MFDFANNTFGILFLLFALSLAPFIMMSVSSFIKLVVVFSIIRNALGLQQVPPNMVVNALAMILSIYVMAPVLEDAYNKVQAGNFDYQQKEGLIGAFEAGSKPFKTFLLKHSSDEDRAFFIRTAKHLWPEEKARDLSHDSLLVLIPAFTVTELTVAFKIGFLLYLPFLVIDLVISNILLALGMMMVSPMTISLPFKLLLFVMVNGWSNMIHGILLTYH